MTVKNQLDRETTDKYNLSVQATDSQTKTIIYVPIEITDINDNSPRFKQDEYAVSVPEDDGSLLYASGGRLKSSYGKLHRANCP